MNKKAILLLATLILTASMTTLETTARYRSSVVVSDQARVARPVIRIVPDADFEDQAVIEPGQTLLYDFSVTNTAADLIVSEVCQTYWLDILEPVSEDRLAFALFAVMDGARHEVSSDSEGRYPGIATMGAVSQTHAYQLEVSLPIETELPDVACPVHLDIQVTAWQID